MTEEVVKDILEHGIIVFDTNVLLNLYFYTTETKNKMIGVMEKYKDRLWMPYQVGWEYFNNRENKIEILRGSCDKIKAKVKESKDGFAKLLDDNFKRHPYIVREKLKELFNKGLESVEKELNTLQAKDPDYAKNDTVWQKLTDLYDGRVGDDYDLDRLNAIYLEGEKRYALEIPPGYCDIKDKKDRGSRHLYGDLIIWKMSIEHAAEIGADLIFVTEDKKPDWYDKKKQLPRKDLMCEFRKESNGQSVLLCDQEGFLRLVEKHLGEGMDEEAMEEIKDVAKEEEIKRNREMEELERIRKKSLAITQQFGGTLDSSLWDSSLINKQMWIPGLSLSGSVYSRTHPMHYRGSWLTDPSEPLVPLEMLNEEFWTPKTISPGSMGIPNQTTEDGFLINPYVLEKDAKNKNKNKQDKGKGTNE